MFCNHKRNKNSNASKDSPQNKKCPIIRYCIVCENVFLLKGLHGVNTSFTSPLDETLDKEVLLMLQGPHPEHMAQEFRRQINKMVKLLH